jgi:vitamin K-dependent gamma-carboxylase-like protein
VSLPERARGAWERFWFAPETARNLSAARIILAAQALWILLSRDIPGLSRLPAEFWTDVPASARWRFLIWEGHPGLETALQAVTVAALLGVLLGVAARACCLLAALLLYHMAPLETLFFTPSPWAKGLTLPVLGLLTLSLSPCADALRLGGRRSTAVAGGPEHGWPLRLTQLFACQPYLFSGIAKLRSAGLGWASAENMRAWLLLANQDDQLAVFRAPGLWLADRPALCAAMGALGLAMDLGFIVVLFSRRSRWVLVPAALLFHAAIVVTQNYAFLSAPLLLIFVDWGPWTRGARRPDGGSASGRA